MELKTLQFFLAVTERLNFSAAARELYISQPTLSLRISSLEEELNCKLFERNKRNVYLTNVGAQLIPVVQSILEQVNQIYDIARNQTDEISQVGSLQIGFDNVDDDYTRFGFYNTLSSIINDYPQVRVEVHSISYEEGLNELKNGNLDLCILLVNPRESLDDIFNEVTLYKEEIVYNTVCEQGHTLEELQDKVRLTIRNDPRWDNIYINDLKERGYHFGYTYVPNNISMQVMLRSQSFLNIAPLSYCRNLQIEKLQTFSLEPPFIPEIKAVWRKNNINPAIQLLLNKMLSDE